MLLLKGNIGYPVNKGFSLQKEEKNYKSFKQFLQGNVHTEENKSLNNKKKKLENRQNIINKKQIEKQTNK